jgi:hypothetical protein
MIYWKKYEDGFGAVWSTSPIYEKGYWEKLQKSMNRTHLYTQVWKQGFQNTDQCSMFMTFYDLCSHASMNSSWGVSSSSAKCITYHSKVLRFQYLHIFNSAQANRNCLMNVSSPLPDAHSAGDVRTSGTDRHCAAVFHTS